MTRKNVMFVSFFAAVLVAIGVAWNLGSSKVEAPAMEDTFVTASNEKQTSYEFNLSTPAVIHQQLVVEKPIVVRVGGNEILLNTSDWKTGKTPFERFMGENPRDELYYDKPTQ